MKTDDILSMGPETWRDPESPYYDPLRVKAWEAESKKQSVDIGFHPHGPVRHNRLPQGITVIESPYDLSTRITDSVSGKEVTIRVRAPHDIHNAVVKLLEARQEKAEEVSNKQPSA